MGAAGVAVDGALFVAGGAVFLLAGDGFEVGGVVLRGHLDVVEEELGEGGVAVEDVGAFGVDVDEVECGLAGGLGTGGEAGLDAAEELAEDGRFERVEEEEKHGRGGESKSSASCSRTSMGASGLGGGVGGVGAVQWATF